MCLKLTLCEICVNEKQNKKTFCEIGTRYHSKCYKMLHKLRKKKVFRKRVAGSWGGCPSTGECKNIKYPYNGILLNNTKKWTTDKWNNMVESKNNFVE